MRGSSPWRGPQGPRPSRGDLARRTLDGPGGQARQGECARYRAPGGEFRPAGDGEHEGCCALPRSRSARELAGGASPKGWPRRHHRLLPAAPLPPGRRLHPGSQAGTAVRRRAPSRDTRGVLARVPAGPEPSQASRAVLAAGHAGHTKGSSSRALALRSRYWKRPDRLAPGSAGTGPAIGRRRRPAIERQCTRQVEHLFAAEGCPRLFAPLDQSEEPLG
jgi:hypothetical protein